jgi:hypothetical protein
MGTSGSEEGLIVRIDAPLRACARVDLPQQRVAALARDRFAWAVRAWRANLRAANRDAVSPS